MTTIDDDDVGSEQAEDFARRHPGLVQLGRVGWVAKGGVYVLTGGLAVAVAAQSMGEMAGQNEEASQSGAVATIAAQPAGAVLLVVIAIGLAIYSVWRLVSIALPADNDAHAWLTRTGYLASAITYLALGWSAVSIALRSGSSEGSEDARVESVTREVLSNTGGRVAIIVTGLGIIAAGAYFLYKAIAATFESDLAPGGVGPISHHSLVTLGRVGWFGRSLMFGLIGYFLVRAAIDFDPDGAVGLDGALRRVSGTTEGTVLVSMVALGLVAHGLFCIISAPRQRLIGAD